MVVIPEAHKTEISISECGEFVLMSRLERVTGA